MHLRSEVERIKAILEEREKHVDILFNEAKEAVDKAEKAQDKRLDLLNEFRAQAADEQSKFVTKDVHDLLVDSVSDMKTNIARLWIGGAMIGFGVVANLVKLWFAP